VPLRLTASAFFVGKALTIAVFVPQLPDKSVREAHRNHKQRNAKNGREDFHNVGGRLKGMRG
jgi:hypothetical protein